MTRTPLTSDDIRQVMVLRYPSPDARSAFTALVIGNNYNIFSNIDSNIVEAVKVILADPIRRETTLYGDTRIIMTQVTMQCMASRVEATQALTNGLLARVEAYTRLQEEVYAAPEIVSPKEWRISSNGIAVLYSNTGVAYYRVTLGESLSQINHKTKLMLSLADVPVIYTGKLYDLDVPEKTSVRKMTGKIVGIWFTSPVLRGRKTDETFKVIARQLTAALRNQGIEAVAAEPEGKYDFLVDFTVQGENVVTCSVHKNAKEVAAKLGEIGFEVLLDATKKGKSDAPSVGVGATFDHNDALLYSAQVRGLASTLANAIAEAVK